MSNWLVDKARELGADKTPETTTPARMKLIGGIALALMAYATWSIFESRFPDGWKWLAVPSTLLVEGASLVWFHAWTNRAIDAKQLELSKWMFVLMIAGSVVTSLASAGEQMGIFLFDQSKTRMLAYIVVASFGVINAVAWMAYEILSPEHKVNREDYLATAESSRDARLLKLHQERVEREKKAVEADEELLKTEQDLYKRRLELERIRREIEGHKAEPPATPPITIPPEAIKRAELPMDVAVTPIETPKAETRPN